jgi:hypothetical protein
MIPQSISEVHPKLMALQYPLLYPYGEDGFMLEIPYINEGNKEEICLNVGVLCILSSLSMRSINVVAEFWPSIIAILG